MHEVLPGELAEVADRPHSIGELGVLGDDHAALAGRDDLVGVQTEAAHAAEPADPTPLVTRAGGLGRVLDNDEPVSGGQLEQRVEVHRMAEEVHEKNGSGSRCEPLLDLSRLEVVGSGIDIGKDRSSTLGQDRIGGGDAGERGGNHLVPGPISSTDSATWSAAVPVFVATAWRVSQSRAKPASSS